MIKKNKISPYISKTGQQIITNDVSWDEAHIGYWCKMKRTGEYNQNFWRLLQSPYYLKRGKKTDCKIANMNVSHLLKKYPSSLYEKISIIY